MNAMFNPMNIIALGALGGLLRDRHGRARLGLPTRLGEGTSRGLNLALCGDGSARVTDETPAEADRKAAVRHLDRLGPPVASCPAAPLIGAQEETR
jgi:hypothetical protein